MKLSFFGTTCNQSDIICSELLYDGLQSCHTMRANLVVAFYPYSANLFDENLICKYKTVWHNLQPVLRILETFGIAPCHPDSEQTGCICVFNVTGENLDDVDFKSVYSKRLAKVTQTYGFEFWILRVKVNKKG